MAVNLYDSPAQAQFINTYVPIQFEGLYKVAEKAQKNLDEIEALQDEVVSKYSTINTPSKIDKANYEARYNQIRDWTNKKITSGESLKDPVLQSEYKSLVRRFTGDRLIGDIIDNAKSLKEFNKNSDPRWGDLEKNKSANWDSRNGLFDESNIRYESIGELVKPAVDDLKETQTSKRGSKYTTMEISKQAVENQIEGYVPNIAGTDAARMHWDAAKNNGTATYYAIKNPDGTISEEKSYINFLKQRGMSDHSDKVRKTETLSREWEIQDAYNKRVAEKKAEEFKAKGESPIVRALEYGKNEVSAKKRSAYLNPIFNGVKKIVGPDGKATYSLTKQLADSGYDKSKLVGLVALQEQQSAKEAEYNAAVAAEANKTAPAGSSRKALNEYNASIQKYQDREAEIMNYIEAKAGDVVSSGKGSILGLTKEDVAGLHTFNTTQTLADAYASVTHGEQDYELKGIPGKFKKGGADKGYTVADPVSLVNSGSTAANAINNLMNSGELDNSMFYRPTATNAMKGDGNETDGGGFVYIPVNEFNNAIVANQARSFNSTGTGFKLPLNSNPREMVKSIPGAKVERIVLSPAKGDTETSEGTPEVAVEYIVVPVKSEGVGYNAKANALTWGQSDEIVLDKGWGYAPGQKK